MTTSTEAVRRVSNPRGALDVRPLDRQFGCALVRWARPAPEGGSRALLERLGERLSAELGRQNVCLELSALAAEEGFPSAEEMIATLRASDLLGDAERPAPLVLDGDRLYLARIHGYEERLAQALVTRARRTLLESSMIAGVAERLRVLFPDAGPGEGDGDPGDEPDWQRVAAAMALDRGLAVIAGGPGTGKTTTVARLLVLLLESAGDAPLRVRLAAPTGKAAARLTESIRDARAALEAEGLADPDTLARLPETAQTLHRMLGYRSPENRFRHGPEMPLAADVVVVDEASMVDLGLMAALVGALPDDARLVLVGDKDQLSSVEAGRVLADLCAWADAHPSAERFSHAAVERLGALASVDLSSMAGSAVPPLADGLCLLRRSRRFDADAALGRFAAAVNAGDVDGAMDTLGVGDASLSATDPAAVERLVERITDGYADAVALAAEGAPDAVLAAFGAFQVLCASRHGPLGVTRMNAAVARALRARGLVSGADELWAGRPIMITVNDYQLGLFNGDTGVILRGADGVLRAWFLAPDRTARSVHARRLPPHETAFAVTVHKSQGSEFDRVLVVLADDEERLLTRELLYTAVTRARSSVEVCATAEAIRMAVEARAERRSGLRDRLWADTEG